MIKWPEPVGYTDKYWLSKECGGQFSKGKQCGNIHLHTNAQLKQAVRDAVEACARVADCRDLPATSAAIRALIKEIPE